MLTGFLDHRWQEGCGEGEAVDEERWSGLQDSNRSSHGHLGWSVWFRSVKCRPMADHLEWPNRQEVPVHLQRLHSWPYPHRTRHLYKDDPHNHHPERLHALCAQISCVNAPLRLVPILIHCFNQIGMRSATRTLPHTARQHSVWMSETSLPSVRRSTDLLWAHSLRSPLLLQVNADRCPRPCGSTFSG